MDRRWTLGALFWASWACAAALQAQPAASLPSITLRTAAQEATPPKYIIEPRGLSGLCPDILHAIERLDPQLHFDIDPAPHPIKRLEQGLKSGQLDVLCALVAVPERDKLALRLGTVLYTVEERLVARADDAVQVHSLAELAALDEQVATHPGASYAGALRAHGVRVDTSSGDNSASLRKIAAGRLRFFYTSDLVAAYVIRTEGFAGKLRVLPTPMQLQPVYFWVRRTLDPALAQRLDKALATLRANGELARLHKTYLIKS